jgi:hypothetical protein
LVHQQKLSDFSWVNFAPLELGASRGDRKYFFEVEVEMHQSKVAKRLVRVYARASRVSWTCLWALGVMGVSILTVVVWNLLKV